MGNTRTVWRGGVEDTLSPPVRRANVVVKVMLLSLSVIAQGGCDHIQFGGPDGSTHGREDAGREVAARPSGECRRETTAPRDSNAGQETWTNSLGMEFVRVPAGEFMRGSKLSAAELSDRFGVKAVAFEDQFPRHKVTLTKTFYLGVTEVTQKQWRRVMGELPEPDWGGPLRPDELGDNLPVGCSWHDAVAFCEKLSEKEGRRYSLPTEAEWEYACRAGSDTIYHFGDETDELAKYAWYCEEPYDLWIEGALHPRKVATKKPNAWGLFDMHGNVNEWCQDWFGAYPESDTVDPTGPKNGEARVIRGGNFVLIASYCLASSRSTATPRKRGSGTGFRVRLDAGCDTGQGR